MNELNDYWIEQQIYSYESRLRLADNIYINPHKENRLDFIPIDDLPEYKHDRKRYLNLPRKRTWKRMKNQRNLSKPKEFVKEPIQPEILTDTDLSSENDRYNERIHRGNRKLRKISQHKIYPNSILSKNKRNLLSQPKRVKFNKELSKK